MANPTYTPQGWAARALSLARKTVDGAISDASGQRMSDYQEPFVTLVGASNHPLADEGSYFKICNATPGTGIATGAAVTAFSNTTPYLIIQNNDQARSLYMDYIRLTSTAAYTGATALHATLAIDTINTRYTSGATMIVNSTGATGGQISSPRSSQTAPATVAVWAGPVTAAAASANQRIIVPDLILRTAIPVIGDQFTMKFGGIEGLGSGLALNGTAPSQINNTIEPVIIDPGHALVLCLWAPASSAGGTFQPEIGGWLR
jgi:hypothetical protein